MRAGILTLTLLGYTLSLTAVILKSLINAEKKCKDTRNIVVNNLIFIIIVFNVNYFAEELSFACYSNIRQLRARSKTIPGTEVERSTLVASGSRPYWHSQSQQTLRYMPSKP